MLVFATIIKCNACSNELRIEGSAKTLTTAKVKKIVEQAGWQWHAEADTHYCFMHSSLGVLADNGQLTLTPRGKWKSRRK